MRLTRRVHISRGRLVFSGSDAPGGGAARSFWREDRRSGDQSHVAGELLVESAKERRIARKLPRSIGPVRYLRAERGLHDGAWLAGSIRHRQHLGTRDEGRGHCRSGISSQASRHCGDLLRKATVVAVGSRKRSYSDYAGYRGHANTERYPPEASVSRDWGQCRRQSGPFSTSTARIAAALRFSSPSLVKILLMCCFTVFSLIPRIRATSPLLFP